jgi:hypothetical protein
MTLDFRSGGKAASLHAPSTNPLANKLLAALPRRDFDALKVHLTVVFLMQGDVVYEAGSEVDSVYFPHSGMFSFLAVMRTAKRSKRRPSGAKAWSVQWPDWVSIHLTFG